MSFNLTQNNPDWDALCQLISTYKNKHWVISEDYFPVFEQLLSSDLKPHAEAQARLTQLKQGIAQMLSELQLNEQYLSQQLFPSPIGLLQFDKWVLPPDASLYAGEVSMMLYVIDVVTEQIRNANFQMELMAKQGYALRLETDVILDPSQTKMANVRLTGVDHKGRFFEVGRIPVLGVIPMQATTGDVSLPFKGVLLDSANATSSFKGPIGELALQLLKGPFTGMLGKMHARKNITPTPLIDEMKAVMYAPHAAITATDALADTDELREQVVIPLNTFHRSVQAQLNKVLRDFGPALSSAIQRGMSVPELRTGLMLSAKFCRDNKPSQQAAIDEIIKNIIPSTDRSGAGYLKKHLQATLQRPTADKERDFWQHLISGKDPAAHEAIIAVYSLMQSGAGLYMNLPRKDFKFQQLPLKRAFPQYAAPRRERAAKPASTSSANSKTVRPADGEKSASSRLPGQREQHFKTIESIVAAMEGSTEQRIMKIVDAVAPGLHPHFVMHRIESLNHLIRSVQASQDPNFVKAGIYMMISCIEAQYRETGIVQSSVLPEQAAEVSAPSSRGQENNHARQPTRSGFRSRP